jgi:hypothetical protein
MDRDAPHVLERLGIQESLADLSVFPHKTNASDRTAEFYTPSLIEKVGRVFAADVELGDYEPPSL